MLSMTAFRRFTTFGIQSIPLHPHESTNSQLGNLPQHLNNNNNNSKNKHFVAHHVEWKAARLQIFPFSHPVHAVRSPSPSSLQTEFTDGLWRAAVHQVWKKPLLTLEIHRKRRVCGHSPSQPYSKLCFFHRQAQDELDATAQRPGRGRTRHGPLSC